MKNLRIFIVISLLLLLTDAKACIPGNPLSYCNNYLYKLTEDISIYRGLTWGYPVSHPFTQHEEENISLWRQQTGGKITDSQLKWYVYTATLPELQKKKGEATAVFGSDGYRLLQIAKECEAYRTTINDPWYYPCKNDTNVDRIERMAKEAANYTGRYMSRYALQTVRLYVSVYRYREAIEYWEANVDKMQHDVVWQMAERHIGRAYLYTGDTATAFKIYANYGDIGSLRLCGFSRREMMEKVYEHTPDSPYLLSEMQQILTYFDGNGYCTMFYKDYFEPEDMYDEDDDVAERLAVNAYIKDMAAFCQRVVSERKVKDMASWYYAQAALLDILGEKEKALDVVKEGLQHCVKGTFLANSMRVLRIYIEAEVCKYDDAYASKLATDIKWLIANGINGLRNAKNSKAILDAYIDDSYYYSVSCSILPNVYYWCDVTSRILNGVVAERLYKEGRETEAVQYSNLAASWALSSIRYKNTTLMSYWYESNGYSFDEESNQFTGLTENCKPDALAKAYNKIVRPVTPLDSLVARYGMTDASFWGDRVGTRYISYCMFQAAVPWLKMVSRAFQSKQTAWEYYDRDPLLLERTHTHNSYDYKLNYAKTMAAYYNDMTQAPTTNERATAHINYGIGIQNLAEWCWSLRMYYFSRGNADEEKFLKYGRKFIDKGIDMMEDRETKAHYLHLFVRNKEVMDNYSDTKTAASLRAHCDLWRDYKTKKKKQNNGLYEVVIH